LAKKKSLLLKSQEKKDHLTPAELERGRKPYLHLGRSEGKASGIESVSNTTNEAERGKGGRS